MADAAYEIVTADSRVLTGQFLIDDEVLKGAGVTDFSAYRDPGVAEEELIPDFFPIITRTPGWGQEPHEPDHFLSLGRD